MIDFKAICARHDIHLGSLPAHIKDIGGIAIRHKNNSMILYDDERADSSFILAQELGHAFLGHFDGRDAGKAYGTDQWKEIEANIFAIVILAVSEVVAA